MRIIVTNTIRLVSPSPSTIEHFESLCTFENPKFSLWHRAIRNNPKLRFVLEKPEEYLNLSERDNGDLILPRGMLEEVRREFPKADYVINLSNPKLDQVPKLNVKLRPYQIEAINTLTTEDTGILCSPTGSGKTIMGLGIISTIGSNALFVVHTKRLLEQTISEIQSKLSYTPGIIGNGKFNLQPITVATIQTLLKRDMSSYKDYFGTIICDECHHLPAKSFSKLPNIFNAKQVYGLSATPTRPDGLTFVLDLLIGTSRVVIQKQDLIDTKSIIKPEYIQIETPYTPSREYDAFEISQHIEEITTDSARNAFIVHKIKEILDSSSPTDKFAILSSRINHIEYLADQLKKYSPVVYHGALPNQKQIEAVNQIKSGAKITIATYDSIGEGFDQPSWNRLFLTSPFSSSIRTVQLVGRVSRISANKTTAKVYDFIDPNDSLLTQRASKRKLAIEG